MQQCVGQQCLLMEEQLMIQQQQMEEDQRWLEQEERLLVTHTVHTLENSHAYTEANRLDEIFLLEDVLLLYLMNLQQTTFLRTRTLSVVVIYIYL